MISEKEITDALAEDIADVHEAQALIQADCLKASGGDFELARIAAYLMAIAARQAYEKLTKTQQALEAVQEVE